MSEQYPECCCPSPDGIVCIAIRYNQEIEDVDEPCECHCHFQEERSFGQGEDDFYFDIDDDLDGFDDDGNRHNEMWDSPEQVEDIPILDSNVIRFSRHREYGFPDIDLITVFGITPAELGELSDNLHGHESREELYRKLCE